MHFVVHYSNLMIIIVTGIHLNFILSEEFNFFYKGGKRANCQIKWGGGRGQFKINVLSSSRDSYYNTHDFGGMFTHEIFTTCVFWWILRPNFQPLDQVGEKTVSDIHWFLLHLANSLSNLLLL